MNPGAVQTSIAAIRRGGDFVRDVHAAVARRTRDDRDAPGALSRGVAQSGDRSDPYMAPLYRSRFGVAPTLPVITFWLDDP